MLLTTLALVKRKVGKLPSRRTKLYAEAVSVLLNWNPRYYKVIEEDEAIPQLEYSLPNSYPHMRMNQISIFMSNLHEGILKIFDLIEESHHESGVDV